MYVFEHYASSRGEDGELFGPFVTTLWEMSVTELKAANASASPLCVYEGIHSTVAHRWVKQGGHHATPLYIGDNGRIRYARDAS